MTAPTTFAPGRPAGPGPSSDTPQGARGITPQQARAAYNRAERPYRRMYRAGSGERAFAVALYQSGLSVRDVCAYLSRTYRAVRSWLDAAGVDVFATWTERLCSQHKPDQAARVYQLRFVDGRAWVDVCRAIGAPPERRPDLRRAAVRYAQERGLPVPGKFRAVRA